MRKCAKSRVFSVDSFGLYANLVRVKLGRTGADGGGMKTGFRSSGGLVFAAALRQSRPGPGKPAAFRRKPPRRASVAADGNPPPTFLSPMRYCGGTTIRTLARLLLQAQSRWIGCGIVHVLGRVGCKEDKKSGVDRREIREIRENWFAFVRVFRVVRGENAFFWSLLSLLAANQWKCLSMRHLYAKPGFSRPNSVKPSQTQSNHFFCFDQDWGASGVRQNSSKIRF